MEKFNANYAKACARGDAPFCGEACPFGFEVREFISKLNRGSLSAAYKAYRQAVVFPALVSAICTQPCAQACPRSQTDEAVRLRELERAVVALTPARDQNPVKYNLPPKPQPVAVIGGGPCGLAFALRLSAKGYPVTVFEKEKQLGGSFLDRVEPELAAAEIARQSQASPYQTQLGREIHSLEELGEYQAILIATGASGPDFGCSRDGRPQIHAGNRPGVFLAGQLMGADLLSAIHHGALAAVDVEKYLKLGNCNFQPELRRVSRLPRPLPSQLSPQAAVEAADPERGYSKEEALAEAARCLKCDCDRCFAACEFMQHHRKYPTQLASAVEFGLRLDVVEPKTNNRLVNACSDCGLCRAVCPYDLDSGKELMLARHQMFEQAQVSDAYHEYLLRDMEHALSPAAFLARPAAEAPTEYVFFPGCQLTASDPEYTRIGYELLCQAAPHTGLLLACCGAPAYWSGDEELRQRVRQQLLQAWQDLGRPTLVLACPTCGKQLDRFLPEISWVNLWSLLKSLDLPRPAPGAARRFALAHPCAAKEDPAWDADIQALLHRLGVNHQELSPAGTAPCCGYGGDIAGALPQLQEAKAAGRTAQSPLPYLCYCANCRDVYANRGKEAWHVLDLLLGRETPAPAPDLTQRRRQRERAKALLAPDSGLPALEHGHISLIIDPQVRQEMARERLTEDELRRVLAFAQDSGLWLEKPDGLCVAHLDLGVITAWAEYYPQEQGFVIKRVYCHRMKIAESGRESKRSAKRLPHYVRS